MSEIEIKLQISRLTSQYQEEMINQNNCNSLKRSYHRADQILKQIQELKNQLKNKQD